MNTDDEKPTEVVNDLEGLKTFLDGNIPTLNESIPTLNESIPTLDESIPVLDEAIESPQNIKVSFDREHSTETIEQQLIRTRYEEQASPPELVTDEIPELDEAPIPTETTHQISAGLLKEEEHQDDSNETEIEQSTEQRDEQPNFTFVLEQEVPDLELQQQEIESEASELRADKNEIKNEDLLDKAWTKVEMLLMDNMPTQLSGAFLELLNSKIDENKQQIFNELSLLDSDMYQELSDALDDNSNDEQGF